MTQPPSLLSRRALYGVAGLASALLLAYGTPAHAQQSELDALRQQIAEMTARLQKLEDAQVAAKAAPQPTVQSASKTPVVISGLLQTQYNSYFSQEPARANVDSFRLRRAEMRVAAPTITPRFGGSVQFDFAKTTNTSPAGSILQELILTYALDKDAKSPKFIDIGQYKLPIGYEGDQVSSGALPFIERSLIYRARDPFAGSVPNQQAGGYGDVRDTGARLRGSFGRFDYNLGVYNGLGERQNTLAGGDAKALIGRVAYRPTFLEGLQLGLSGAIGNNRGITGGVAVPGGNVERSLYNVYGVYKKDKLTLQGEYLLANSQSISGAIAGNIRDVEGYYGHVGYLLTPKIEVVGRYDIFDAARNAPLGITKEQSLGVNYFIKGNSAKIQANLVRVDGGPGSVSTSDSTQLRTQFQLGF